MWKILPLPVLSVLTQLILLKPRDVLAQTTRSIRAIKGLITGKEDNEPVHRAAVLFKHTHIDAITDTNGNFLINASSCNTLVISNMAYETVTIPVDGKSHPEIRLKKDNKALTEIVVTSLGFIRQAKSLGNAVQAENSRQLTEAEGPNFINNIKEKIAGHGECLPSDRRSRKR